MRIVIVDDHPLVRQGISSILSLDEMLELAGQAGDREEALQLLNKEDPDLTLMDLKLADDNGLEIIKVARQEGCQSKFIILTSSVDKDDFRQAGEIGVDGYVLKEALPEEILSAIRIVGKGRKYYDPGLMELMLADTKDDEDDELKELTPRELEVLKALGRGLSNKEIARELFITEYTVKKHVSQILDKLQLSDRTQAAIFANSKGLI
ncbi:MAG: response regulator transcription factor [Clostridia bacterium]|nr:response regulator transcription factor [Clostridia bacterium]